MIYSFLKYKDYIRKQLSLNEHIKGYQSLLAKAAGCQRPYISQVMNGGADISLDHAAGLCSFWDLNENETEYFICLVEYARAGTPVLKKILKNKIKKYRIANENLTKRFNKPGVNSIDAQAAYYSSWTWAAIHILITIPSYNSLEKICQRLSLSKEEAMNVLTGLASMGLIFQRGQKWFITEKHIHLPKESPFNSINHMNWRQKSIQNSMFRSDDSLHYTGIHSLSLKDYDSIKAIFYNSIDLSHDIIKPSKEEELIYIGIDLFKVI